MAAALRGSRRSWRPAGSAMRAARRARSQGCLGDRRRQSSNLASPPRMIAMGDVLSFAGDGFGSNPRRVQNTPGTSRIYDGLASFSTTTWSWAAGDRVELVRPTPLEPLLDLGGVVAPPGADLGLLRHLDGPGLV